MKVICLSISLLFVFCLMGVDSVLAQDCPPNIAIDFHTQEVRKDIAEVKAYTPARGGSMVHESNYNYVLYATSKKDRDEWLGRFKTFQRGGACDMIDPALDELAVAVAAKIGNAAPKAEDFRYHDPEAERVLMTIFHDSKTIKVFKIGLDSAGWQIQTGSLGLPSYRYKDGYVWVRDTSDDQPNCHLYSARIKQDYAGGGTYSREIYRSSPQDRITGCPAPGK